MVVEDRRRKMVGLIQTHCKHMNLDLIGKWKNLEVLSLGPCLNLAKILAIIPTHCKNFYGLDLSKGSVHGREALSIVKMVPNIKYLNLKGAKVNQDGLLSRCCADAKIW